MSDAPGSDPEGGETAEPDRLLAVTVDSAPLGGPVTLRLGERRTVLVGKNGSGKSLLLEGCNALGQLPRITPLNPLHVAVEIGRDGDRLGYGYQTSYAGGGDDFLRGELITERWWQAEAGGEAWAAEGIDAFIAVPPRAALDLAQFIEIPQDPALAHGSLSRIRAVLNAIAIVQPGVPRTDERFDIVLNTGSGDFTGAPVNPRIAKMARTLFAWSLRRSDCFDALVAIGARTELLELIEIKRYEAPGASALVRIFVDGIDIGHLADGTHRGLEILMMLIDPTVTTAIIEEPETGIHPGLLKRLLAEMDAHSIDRKVVISTHSPIVVDWARPDELRLVERVAKKTTVRALDPSEIARVHANLNDDGTLAEFVFGQAG